AIYTENRGVYETFDEFAPILLARMADEPVGSPPPRIHPSRWLPLLLGLVAILGVLWWLSVGLRRRRRQIEMMEDFDDPHDTA
ncbi:MAG: hypothetical protein R6U92_04145, partial [Bacillota bacterium]